MGILAAVKSCIVNVNGTIDLDATLSNIRKLLVAELEQNATMDASIETALDSVYDRLGVDIYPTPEVVSIASATLVGSDLAKMAGVSEQIRDYLGRSARFQGERGRKGGLRRLAKK